MISFYVPSGSQINQYSAKITEQLSKCKNIKSKVNAKSVESGLKSLQHKLKKFKQTPPNGLAIFCGYAEDEEGKVTKITYTITTKNPIKQHIYHCDSEFYTKPLENQLDSYDSYGFIVIDGKGKLFGLIRGTKKEILFQDDVYLPHKHNKGGQSAGRFFRTRIIARLHHLKETAEQAVNYFIDSKTNLPNVKGLFIAGSADLKDQFATLPSFDPRLKEILIRVVTVSYGGNSGFMEAVKLCQKDLENIPFVEESKLLTEYFEHISKDDNLYSFGVRETLGALDNGAVSKLILYKNFDLIRFVEKNNDGNTIVSFKQKTEFNGTLGYTLVDQQEIDDYVRENLNGSELHFVSGKTPEGSQFVNGFGGIGAILRYEYQYFGEKDFDCSESDDSEFM